MKIEDIDFETRKVFAVVMGVFVALVFGVFGTVFAVNIYREVRDPTTALDLWGWIGGGVITGALALLLLHIITLPFRISFAEDGLRVRGLLGRRFVPWSGVRSAAISSHKGNVGLSLRTGRLRGVSIPVSSYKRQATLVAEVSKRLPVPVSVSPTVAAFIKDD
ncbi:MAG TPA: hypothetical protein VM864_08265 [Pyrinomonadaceae bacterium]|jgi:hypothetical protein|nr:hypothetical protein [Pyrinomonadaceae bacterium]